MDAPFAWDAQQQLLDELLLEIFTPGSSDSGGGGDVWGDDVYASPPTSKHVGSPNGFSPLKKPLPPQQQQHGTVSPTASSSSPSSSDAFSGAGCSPGGLDLTGPHSPLSAKEKRQLEMRRKRNRESMRRVRQRKRVEYSELKKLLPGLEARLLHLRELKAQQERQVAIGAAAAMVATTPSDAAPPTGAALVEALEQLRAAEDAFRRENAFLEQEIDKYEQAFVAVQDVVTELRDADALGVSPEEAPDYFAWTACVTAFLPQIQTDEIFAFVRRSVDEVVQQVSAAQKLKEADNTILGWHVRRTVSGPWIHFAMSKEFAHEDVDVVSQKTWFVQSQSHAVNATMPQNHLMKVLRVVNENTVICARNLFFPGDETNYCTIYLLMRVSTPSGYVIAQRSLLPTDAALLTKILGPNFSYVNLFYGMILERHTVVDAGGNKVFAASGCNVTFGGRASNGTEVYVNTSAKDVFVAMLRWESACVGPLYRLL